MTLFVLHVTRSVIVQIGTDVDHSQTANLILKYTKLTSKYIAVGSVHVYFLSTRSLGFYRY